MFKFKKIINIFLLVFCVAFGLMYCLNSFNNTPIINGNNDKIQIYEWWHIESFEGGGANRQNYLNQLALSYEKENPTKLFMVKLIKADELADVLTQNIPDMFSFSEQVANIVLPYLTAFENEYNVKDNFIESATFNEKLMAIPFIASGYCYFSKKNTANLDLYTANNNLHSASPITSCEINKGQTLTSYECYTKFVNSNNIKLLGTARDLFRIKNLENLGRFTVSYEPVSTFTDLIQYIGITSSNKTLLQFVDYVMNDSNQAKLSNLSLFSTKYLKLYSDTTYSKMEECLSSCKVPNIFS
jgi:hypothetical protein